MFPKVADRRQPRRQGKGSDLATRCEKHGTAENDHQSHALARKRLKRLFDGFRGGDLNGGEIQFQLCGSDLGLTLLQGIAREPHRHLRSGPQIM